MKTLLVDVGNSRVKWAILEDGRLGDQQAAGYAGWTVDDWRRALFVQRGVQRVVAATVAGSAAAEAFDAAVLAETGAGATFARTAAQAAGVRNAYPDPQLLGVDRWLAVIAAHHAVRAPCCVVDVGTAATIDAVTREGQHLGGFIVPGPELMAGSLWRGTSRLATHTADSGIGTVRLFADNTRDAIERGCRLAIASLVDRSIAELAESVGEQPALLLTGGDAQAVADYVRTPARFVPDLVLRGLAVIAVNPDG